jgi:hypothetical protein
VSPAARQIRCGRLLGGALVHAASVRSGETQRTDMPAEGVWSPAGESWPGGRGGQPPRLRCASLRHTRSMASAGLAKVKAFDKDSPV